MEKREKTGSSRNFSLCGNAMKKIISLFITVMMVLTIWPTMVFAETGDSVSPELKVYVNDELIDPEEDVVSINALSGFQKLSVLDAEGNDIMKEMEWSSNTEGVFVSTSDRSLRTKMAPVGTTATITGTDSEKNTVSLTVSLERLILDTQSIELKIQNDYGDPYLELNYDDVDVLPSALTLTYMQNKLKDVYLQDSTFRKYIEKQISFQSSNEQVLPSENIQFWENPPLYSGWDLRALSEGSTEISCSVETEYLSWKASIIAQTASGLIINKSNCFMAPGEEQKLEFTIQPSTEPQEVAFESEDPEIAAVDNSGTITANSRGSTTIHIRQVDGSGYEGQIQVYVFEKGIYKLNIKDGEEVISATDTERAEYLDPSQPLQVQSDEPIYLGYYRPVYDSSSYNVTWQSSNTNVARTEDPGRYVVLRPVANGTVDIRALEEDQDKDVEVARFTANVNVPTFETADTDTRESYGPQGAYQTTLEMTGLNISTNPANEFMFENYINTLVDRKAADFSFTVASSKGDGGAIEPDNYVKTYMLDHIKLYQKSDLDHPIATFDDGGMQVTSVEADTDNNPTSVDFSISEEILDFDTEYVLLFDNGFRLNHTLRRDVAFFFKTDAFTKADSMKLSAASANLAVNGEVKLSASFSPQNADDTKLTWTSSDPSVASVDKNGTVRGIKAGTAVITAKNENGLSAECKVTVAAVKVAATSIKASATDYNAAKLSWKKPAGTTGTELYRSTSKSGTYKKIAATTGSSYRDKGLDTGKRVYYKARVYTEVNGTKYYSAYSNIVSVKPTLAKVQGVKANPSYNKVKITYKKTDGANGYVIYRASKKNGKYKKLATVKGNKKRSYTNKKLKTGKRYYYKVRAYRNVGKTKVYGSYSRIVKAKTALKTPSMKVKARSAGTRVSWKKTAGADKYQLYRSTKKKGGYILIRETVKTSFTDTGARAGKTYYYKLRAYKKADGKKVYSKYTEVKKVRVK